MRAALLSLLVVGNTAAASEPPVVIAVAYHAEQCTARIEDNTYRIPADGSRLGAHLARLKLRERRVLLVGNAGVPYRCIGGIIFEAQRLELRLGFVAEPPLR